MTYKCVWWRKETYRLVQGYVVCHDVGFQTLKGFAEPIKAYQVHQKTDSQSRLDAVAEHRLTPLVGRSDEVALLLERWALAKEGMGQVVLLSGEAGLGKSRLVQVVKNQVVREGYTLLECRSSPYYQYTALYPFIGMIQHGLQWQHDMTHEAQLETLEHALRQYHLPLEETIPLLAPVLALPLPEERYPPLSVSPQRQRQKTFDILVAIVSALTAQQPVFFILEDLHWVDPSTLELLDRLIEQTPALALFTILTCRPEFQPRWSHQAHLMYVTLNGLPHTHVKAMVEQVAGGKTLPPEIIRQLIEKTDGVPLFVEEMTKAILELDMLHESRGCYELSCLPTEMIIPNSLQDSLMARLDRLGTAKGVTQIAAVIGRQFSYELLHAVSQLDELTLQCELAQLVEAELLYRPLPFQTRYSFKHALIQDAAYQSLLKSTRRHYHQRIAEVLTKQFPEIAKAQPELLAHHLTEAGSSAQAIPYWYRAALLAMNRSAHLETIGHINQGLALVATMSDSAERIQHELDLQTLLGPTLMAVKSPVDPEVEQAYARAHELCQQVGNTPKLVWALEGLWGFALVRGKFQTARELGEQLLALASHLNHATAWIVAHMTLGLACFYRGEFSTAFDHLERGAQLSMSHPSRASLKRGVIDPGVLCAAFSALTLCTLGYPEQAQQRCDDVLHMVRSEGYPYDEAFALCAAAIVYQCRGESDMVYARADAAVAIADEQGFPLWWAMGTVLRGWALASQGQGVEGVEQVRRGLKAWSKTGAENVRPYFLVLLAEAYQAAGDPAAGLAVLHETQATIEAMGERWWEAETYRLQGELLLMDQAGDLQTRVPGPGVEQCFRRALDVALGQRAKWWELRAATSLSRWLDTLGQQAEARQVLMETYTWFSEGRELADLQRARRQVERWNSAGSLQNL